jgi:outer membrane protein TolC
MKNIFFLLNLLFGFLSFSQEKDILFYTDIAKTNSPFLSDLNNQIKSNSLDSLLNKAVYKLQVNGSLNANFSPNINGFGYDSSVTNGQTITGLIGVNKRIIGKNQINSQSESYKLIKEALVLNKKVALKDLNRIVTSQYITASGSAEQIEYNKKMYSLLKDESIILKKLTQNSIYKQTDYLIFLSSLKQQELLVLQLKQQYQNDIGILNYLCGITDTTYIKLKRPKISLIDNPSKIKSIFLKQFELDSLKILNQNKLIDNRYKPAFNFLSDVGYLSSFYSEGYKNFGFSVGLGLSIPIYDGNQKDLLHQKNQVALSTNLAYKNNFNRQYSQQLLLLNQKLEQTNQIEKQLLSQLQVSEVLIEANKKLLLTGDAQITDFVIALGNLIAINNNLSQNKITKLQIINDLNYWSYNN